MRWVRREIAGIKETLEEIASIKETLEEMASEVREERDNLHSVLADILSEVQECD
jgi:hypothetical protein